MRSAPQKQPTAKTARWKPSGNGSVRAWPLTKCVSGTGMVASRPGRASSADGIRVLWWPKTMASGYDQVSQPRADGDEGEVAVGRRHDAGDRLLAGQPHVTDGGHDTAYAHVAHVTGHADRHQRRQQELVVEARDRRPGPVGDLAQDLVGRRASIDLDVHV